ncbi:hypothetical protein [Dysosmobacter sp.]|uniref:hypothetical protein n=1 Tax=Dysosmobacter sp. TaxID=2591382 RepID=UPI003AB321C0
MKFLTEDDIRKQFRNCPFSVYHPKPREKLTPGAVQFLRDRKVRFDDGIRRESPVIRPSLTREICCPSIRSLITAESDAPWKKGLLTRAFDTADALIRCAGQRARSQRQKEEPLARLLARYDGIRAKAVRAGLYEPSGTDADEAGGGLNALLSQPMAFPMDGLMELWLAIYSLRFALLLSCEDGKLNDACWEIWEDLGVAEDMAALSLRVREEENGT